MAISILNNIAALQAENQISNTQTSLQKTLTQLSSGSRINSGADDAAGLSIADGINANIQALNQSSQNASAGVGKLQVADGALSQVTSLLDRAVTLATESATGTENGDNGTQRTALDAEFSAIKAEITRIGTNTTFNGTAVFGATSANALQSGSTVTVTANTDLGTSDTTGSGNLVLSAGGNSYTFSGTAYAAQSAAITSATTNFTSGGSITISVNGSAIGSAITYNANDNLNTVAAKINAADSSLGVYASVITNNVGKYQLQIADTQNRGAVAFTDTAADQGADSVATFTSATVNMTVAGALTFTVGTSAVGTTITYGTSDNLNSIAAKINTADNGLGLQASVVTVGSNVELQVTNTNGSSAVTWSDKQYVANSGSMSSTTTMATTGQMTFTVNGNSVGSITFGAGLTMSQIASIINADTSLGLSATVSVNGGNTTLQVLDTQNRGTVSWTVSSTEAAAQSANLGATTTMSTSGSLTFAAGGTGITGSVAYTVGATLQNIADSINADTSLSLSASVVSGKLQVADTAARGAVTWTDTGTETAATSASFTTGATMTTGGNLVISVGGTALPGSITYAAAATLTTIETAINTTYGALGVTASTVSDGNGGIRLQITSSAGSATWAAGGSLGNNTNTSTITLAGSLGTVSLQFTVALSPSLSSTSTTSSGSLGGASSQLTVAASIGSNTLTNSGSLRVSDLINEINSSSDGFQVAVANGKLSITDTLNRGDVAVASSTDNAMLSALGGLANPTTTETNPNQLAFGTALSSTAAAALTASLGGSGSKLVLAMGGQSISFTVAANETLGSLVNTINTSGNGLQASVDSTGHLDITDTLNRGNIAVSSTSTLTAAGTASNPSGFSNGQVSVFLSDSTGTGTSSITINLGALSASNINGVNLNSDSLATQAGAQSALTDINTAVSGVSALRGTIGAGVNRLQAASSVITTQVQNLTTAENSVTAADISADVANMTKFNILNQTGISALAQADQMQQGVLKLLQ